MANFKTIRESAIRWAIFGSFAALFMGWIAYALTYNWSDPSALRGKVTGNQMQSSQWNLLVGNVDNLNERLTTAEATVATLASAMPTGAVVAFFGPTCPTGWVSANGTANGVKKTDGTSGTLDLRGEFVRGLDGGRGIDPSRVLGSFQHSTVINHLAWYGGDIWLENPDYLYQSISRSKYENGNTASYTRNEYGLRPRNVALLYCVKN